MLSPNQGINRKVQNKFLTQPTTSRLSGSGKRRKNGQTITYAISLKG